MALCSGLKSIMTSSNRRIPVKGFGRLAAEVQ
jgi:hypothetical protein